MTTERRNKEIVRRYWQDAWNGRKRSDFFEVMEPGYANEEATFADVVWDAFPDIHVDIVEMIAEGGSVAARPVLSATHSGLGAFEGLAPSGRHATIEGVVIKHLVDGRIVREGQISSWDWLGFYRQLGVIPLS